jgi:adenosine deaminase
MVLNNFFYLQTDDCGIFNSSLSEEYIKFSQLVNLNVNQLKKLNVSSISYSFASDEEKNNIKNIIENWWKENYAIK